MPFIDFLLPAFTWHGFGRNSCVLHTALLLLSAVPPKEFCARRAPKIKNSFGPPQNAVAWFGSSRHSLFSRPSKGQKEESQMNFNQVSVIGFLGKAPKTSSLKNGTPVLNFSVATNKYWTDENGERRERTQWHQVVGFGEGFAKLAERLAPGSHVFVQGELQTREYERTIQVPNGKKTIDHKMQQLAVEIRAEIIRVLDRSSKIEGGEAQTENMEAPD